MTGGRRCFHSAFAHVRRQHSNIYAVLRHEPAEQHNNEELVANTLNTILHKVNVITDLLRLAGCKKSLLADVFISAKTEITY